MALSCLIKNTVKPGIVASCVIALTVLTPTLLKAPPAHAQQPSFADLAEGLIDSVVNISTSQKVSARRSVPMPNGPDGSPFQELFKDFFDGKQGPNRARKVSSLGSGFVVDTAGIIITNAHVIKDADQILVNFSNGITLEAKVRGRDLKTDIAVLEVMPEEGQTLTAVPIGSSNTLRVGDWVMAIGNPFGLGGTVTVGIVSARNRNIHSGPYDDYIQTDAAINRGNSGGPLFDVNGNVIGINTAIISPSGGSIGIGFAVPSEIALPVIAQLREFGETRRGWFGIRIQQVTDDIAESLELPEVTGALVSGVNPEGPAETAGVEPGDVILEFDGYKVNEVRELPRIVADTPIGETVDVSVWRKGARVELRVTVARLNEDEMMAAPEGGDELLPVATDFLGMSLALLSDKLREKYELSQDSEGIVVVGISEESAAFEKGLREGDLIVEAAQKKMGSLEKFAKLVEKMKKEDRKSILLLVRRKDGNLRYLGLHLTE